MPGVAFWRAKLGLGWAWSLSGEDLAEIQLRGLRLHIHKGSCLETEPSYLTRQLESTHLPTPNTTMAPSATTEQALFSAPVKGGTSTRIQADPELVPYPTFADQPSTPEQFYARAREVASLLEQDAHIRDRGNVVPHRQVQLLKDSGLVTLLGAREHGGGGQTWSVAYRVVRLVAQGEGSLAQLLGYHYIWFWTAVFVGTDEQIARVNKWLTENRYFIGGAVNPRDADLHVAPKADDPQTWVFNGKKTFSTGSKVSDVTILEGALPDGVHVFAPVLSKQPGIRYGDEWVDTLGMRATQSGGVTIENVEIDAKDALGFVNGQFQALGAFNSLILPAIQVSPCEREWIGLLEHARLTLPPPPSSFSAAHLHLLLPRHRPRRPPARPGIHQGQHAWLAVPAAADCARDGRVLHPRRVRHTAGAPLGVRGADRRRRRLCLGAAPRQPQNVRHGGAARAPGRAHRSGQAQHR